MFKNIIDFYYKYKRYLDPLFIALFALLSALGGYEAGTRNPDPVAVEEALRGRGTPTAVASPTSRPPRGTPTATQVPATLTPSLTPTTPIGVTVTVTPTPVQGAHNPFEWHPYDAGFSHGHGVNPEDYVEVFGPVLSDYLTNYGSISYPWHTPDENLTFGFGHHNGYTWLYTSTNGTCQKFNNGGELDVDAYYCITDVLMQLHTDGTQAHDRKRFHSHYVFMRVCDQTLTKCWTVGTGGWVDYGILEVPYKTTWCPLPGIDPPYFSASNPPNLNQQPYRSSMNILKGDVSALFKEENKYWDQINPDALPMAVQFWSGLRPNKISEEAYDRGNGLKFPQNMPNYRLGVAWSSLDAWGVISTNSCADPESDVFLSPDGTSALNNTAFQIFSVFLYDVPAGPTSGFEQLWTDRYGLLQPQCVNASVDCVPLYIGAGGLAGQALLNRQVDQGNAAVAPIIEFEPGGNIILPPPQE